VVRTAHKARQPLRPSFQPARCTRQLDDGAPDEFSPRRAEGAAVQPRRRSSGQPDAHTCSRKAGTPAFKTPALKRRPLERQLCLMTCSHEGTFLNASLQNACPQTPHFRTPALSNDLLSRGHISKHQRSKGLLSKGHPSERQHSEVRCQTPAFKTPAPRRPAARTAAGSRLGVKTPALKADRATAHSGRFLFRLSALGTAQLFARQFFVEGLATVDADLAAFVFSAHALDCGEPSLHLAKVPPFGHAVTPAPSRHTHHYGCGGVRRVRA
jgi:hypothetical protein